MLTENLLFLREYFLSFFNVFAFSESLQSNKEKEKKHMQMIPKQNKGRFWDTGEAQTASH